MVHFVIKKYKFYISQGRNTIMMKQKIVYWHNERLSFADVAKVIR